MWPLVIACEPKYNLRELILYNGYHQAIIFFLQHNKPSNSNHIYISTLHRSIPVCLTTSDSMSSLLIIVFSVFLIVLSYKYLLFPIFLSPLSRIPNAHFTSSFCPLWILWKRYRGKENGSIFTAHQKHGSIVRLGPTELSVNCVDNGIKTIYGGGFEKPHWYINLFSNYG